MALPRVLFFQDFHVLLNLFRLFFGGGHFLFFRHRTLCPEDKKQKKPVYPMVWRCREFFFFNIFGFFIFYDLIFFEFYFCWSFFYVKEQKSHEKSLESHYFIKNDHSLGEQKKSCNSNNIIGPFSRGGLEKPNPARTIDTLADGS